MLGLGSLVFGVMVGSVSLSATEVVQALIGKNPDLAHQIVWQLRLPRVAGAFACGGLLALAGLLLQVLLRNPLADPYILGVSSGAALAALMAILAGTTFAIVNMAAFVGALLTLVLVYQLSRSGAEWNLFRLLLTGVVLSAGLGALISLILTLAPSPEMRGMLFWLLGDLTHADTQVLSWAVITLIVFLGLCKARSLDVLSAGLLQAKALGVDVQLLQKGIYLTASIATAVAVMQGGTIGFVGLVIPHFLRLLGIAEHRKLIPCAVVAGGSYLVLADTLARSLAAPQQLPVGVITALVGVPVLLFLLARKHA
jgi:iron complex transport system permease protein